MNKRKLDSDGLEEKYGEHFAWHRPYDYFFNKEKGEVTIYHRFKGKTEIYNLDDLESKIRDIFKEKDIVIGKKKAPIDFISNCVAAGLDAAAIKKDDMVSILAPYISGDMKKLEKKLSEEETKLFHALPQEEKATIIKEVTEGSNYDVVMNALYESLKPLEEE